MSQLFNDLRAILDAIAQANAANDRYNAISFESRDQEEIDAARTHMLHMKQKIGNIVWVRQDAIWRAEKLLKVLDAGLKDRTISDA